ncbi:MAG: UvrD-helicase domain-containing protein [Spirochaetales bacterium]|nr:UvrD-helicase domain-containing protein [Candidatus Physcosoma equi]
MAKEKLDLNALLNPEQAAAASQIYGPELIIAGAGSGKTRMITYRIAYMLEQGIDESEILALTFTNKAAKEMSDRVREVTGRKLEKLTTTTFHSFGLGLLKQYIQYLGYRNDFTLYDDNDNTSLIKNCILACGYQLPDYNVYSLKGYLSNYKTGRDNPPEKGTAVRNIYDEWLLTQKAYNVVDFDDLILLPTVLFEKRPDILERVQMRYKYIMVDEFQDTSLLQYKFVSEIAKKYRNIAVVGDDDQSIYSWRGANYKNIVMFETDFPERKEFKLERNYRSSGNILTAANNVIVHNQERKEKKLWTESDDGAQISIRRHNNGEREASWIAVEIRKEMREHHYNYSDFGVLVRTNTLITGIETTFMEMQLPVKISGGSSFFDRKEVRDILCYLKVLINKGDDNSLLRIINTPRRGIGRVTVEKLRKYADNNNLTLWESIEKLSASPDFTPRTQEALKEFIKLLYKWQGFVNRPENLIDMIIRDVHYEAMIREEFPDSDKAVAFKMRGLQYLKERMANFCRKNPDKGLRDYLHSVAILGDEKEDDASKVNLMTMHASKGLEFKVVYLAGIEDNIIPSARALEENPLNIDEERRLFYVAITRAREKLVINYCDTRTDHEGKEKLVLPSRFLEEIPKELFKNEEKSPEETKKSNIESGKAFLEMLRNKSKNK